MKNIRRPRFNSPKPQTTPPPTIKPIITPSTPSKPNPLRRNRPSTTPSPKGY